jgi:hypothetical protein
MPKRTNRPGVSTSNRGPRGTGYRGTSGQRGSSGYQASIGYEGTGYQASGYPASDGYEEACFQAAGNQQSGYVGSGYRGRASFRGRYGRAG